MIIWKNKIWLILLLIFSSCASQTHIRSWRSTNTREADFKKIVVFGLANNVSIRNDLEEEMTISAVKNDMIAVNGMSLFPPELGKPFEDIERVKSRLREKNFDGILTVALIDVNAPRYVGPETTYEPLVYYDRFRNYYYKTYELVYRPGYFASISHYFLETNLYELNSGELVWSGRSRVFDPVEFESYLPGYAKRLFKELRTLDLL